MNARPFFNNESQSTMRSGLFITGTDTGVGKTYITALIARDLRASGIPVGVFKPACSGAEFSAVGEPVWPDLVALSDAAQIVDLDRICPYRLRAPLAPPVAARAENITLDLQEMLAGFRRWQTDDERCVLVEGVGGLLCPLTETHSIADFALLTELPLLIVARLGLGTINHTLLTIDVAQRRGLLIAGVVLNDAQAEADSLAAQTNLAELRRCAPVPILGVVRHNETSLCLSLDRHAARIAWPIRGV